MRRIIYIILLAVVAASCDGEMHRRLAHIEATIDTDSVSAYGDLLAIDSASVKSDADRALYDLLMVEKAVKNYEPITPAIISRAHRAVEYYGDRHLSTQRYDAHFYLGRAYEHAKDYPSAIKPALAALDDANELNDTFRMAKAHNLLGDIYLFSYLVGPELPHRRLAKEYFDSLDTNPLFYAFAVIDLAECLYFNESNEECIAMLDSNNSYFDSMPADVKNRYKCCYIRPLIDMGLLDKAKHLLLEMFGGEDYRYMNIVDYKNITNIYVRQDSLEQAKYWLSQMEHRFNNSANYVILLDAKYAVSKRLGDTENALQVLDSINSFDKKLYMKLLQSHLQDYAQDYQKERKEKIKARHYRSILWFSTIAIILIMSIVLLIINYRHRLYHAKSLLENKISEIQSLRNDLEAKLADNNDKKSRLYLSALSALNSICDLYFRKKNQGKTAITLNSVIESELARLRDGDYLRTLEGELNSAHNNIIADFKINFPDCKNDNIALIVYSLMGFPPRVIAFLLAINIANFYTRRKRIRVRISDSEWPRKDEFLDFLQ